MEQTEAVVAHLSRYKLMEPDEIRTACQYFQVQDLNKSEFFLKAGERCSKIGFLLEGLICSFVYDANGEVVVKHFVQPLNFFTDNESYEQQIPAKLNLQAITGARVYYITRQNNMKVQEEFPNWIPTLKMMSADALQKMIQMQNFLHLGSAVDKYRHLLKHYPTLLVQAPLKYIASYLGITQSSLSRIRRENL